MIKYLLILIFSFSVILKADAFDPDVEITIKGLVCQLCAVGLKKTFAKHINVKGLKMDTEKGILSFFDPTRRRNDVLRRARMAIDKAWYKYTR